MTTREQQLQQRASSSDAPPARRRLDAEASEIGFGVRKMGLYTVKGRFRAAEGEMQFDERGQPTSGEVTLDAASVSTRMPPRDLHLRSGHFLDVKEHPTIRLQADDIAMEDDGTFRVPALVTIKGESRRIELHAHRHEDPEHLVVHVTGQFDRHEFGIRPPVPFDWVVGRRLDLSALLVFVR